MKLSEAQRRALKYASEGYILMRSTGLDARASWKGYTPDAPRVTIVTADILVRRRWVEIDPNSAERFWAKFYRISPAGRQALEEQT